MFVLTCKNQQLSHNHAYYKSYGQIDRRTQKGHKVFQTFENQNRETSNILQLD